MAIRVLVNDPLDASAMEELKKIPNVTLTSKHYEQEELKKVIADYEILVVRSATKANKDIIDAGKNLKLIARAGTGLDNVDSKAAKEKHIKVINTPGANAISVAELSIGFMLSLLRYIPRGTAGLKEGKWEKKELEGHEIFGKTVGIVGFGAIGKEIAKRLLAFGCKIIAYDVVQIADGLDVRFVTLDELYKNSDIITVHAPLMEATKKMMNEDAFRKMKNGVYFIHAARGGIVDDKALCDALESGKVAAAALDVFEVEPPVDELRKKLLSHPKVIGTPHIGASTLEAQERVGLQIVGYLAKEIAQMH